MLFSLGFFSSLLAHSLCASFFIAYKTNSWVPKLFFCFVWALCVIVLRFGSARLNSARYRIRCSALRLKRSSITFSYLFVQHVFVLLENNNICYFLSLARSSFLLLFVFLCSPKNRFNLNKLTYVDHILALKKWRLRHLVKMFFSSHLSILLGQNKTAEPFLKWNFPKRTQEHHAHKMSRIFFGCFVGINDVTRP